MAGGSVWRWALIATEIALGAVAEIFTTVSVAPAVVDEPDHTDFGLYAGQNADAFAPLPPAPAGFQLLFEDDMRRF